MAWEWKTTLSGTSPRGQWVEYQQRPGNGYSMAESPARVVVSGKVVKSGWSCAGDASEEYFRIMRDGYTPTD